jgi:hypothetical protein
VAFAGGWKAQGPDDDHALVLWVELTRGFAASSESREWLGARWIMIASRLRSNKEFSSELQEINDFDTQQFIYHNKLLSIGQKFKEETF